MDINEDEIVYHILHSTGKHVKNFGQHLHLLDIKNTKFNFQKNNLLYQQESSPSLMAGAITIVDENDVSTIIEDDGYGESEQVVEENVYFTLVDGQVFIPEILEIMCQYIFENGRDVKHLFQRERPQEKELNEVKDSFSRGKFYDCGSVMIIACLLKIWLSELPTPLIPNLFYNKSINIVEDYLNSCVSELSEKTEFKKYNGSVSGEEVWAPLWEKFLIEDPIYGQNKNSSVIGNENNLYVIAQVVEEYAFGEYWDISLGKKGFGLDPNLREGESPVPDTAFEKCLEEIMNWLSDLPELNNYCLEYLCVFFCMFSVVSVDSSLESLAKSFAPCMLQPATYTSEELKTRTEYLQQQFILLLCRYFQTKYRSLRRTMESSIEELINQLEYRMRQMPNIRYDLNNTDSFDKRGLNAPQYVPNIKIRKEKVKNNITMVNLTDYDVYAKPIGIEGTLLTSSAPRNQERHLEDPIYDFEVDADSPLVYVNVRKNLFKEKKHRIFAPEWELDSGQYVDVQGTILFRNSNFLRYSPYSQKWLNEPTRRLNPQFRKQRSDDNQWNWCYEMEPINDTEIVAPGKGLLLQDTTIAKPFARPEIIRDFISIRKEIPIVDQGNTCKICNYSLNIISRRKRNCNNCGIIMCEYCCKNKMPIPCRIVQCGDFDSHSVCSTCEEFISKNLDTPFVTLKDLQSPRTVSALGRDKLKKLHDIHYHLVHLIYDVILPDCPSKLFLLGLITSKYLSFLSEGDAAFSIVDLFAIKAHHYLPFLESIHQLYMKHLRICEYCGPKNFHTTPSANDFLFF